jgi:hypothetical protein
MLAVFLVGIERVCRHLSMKPGHTSGAQVDACRCGSTVLHDELRPVAACGTLPGHHSLLTCCVCARFCCCCRTRLLRSLPKLDSNTAQQLTAFLAEVQQHTPAGHGSTSTASTPSATAADNAVAVSKEEQQWWQQASLAYSLLKDQAGKVQQQQPNAEEQQ